MRTATSPPRPSRSGRRYAADHPLLLRLTTTGTHPSAADLPSISQLNPEDELKNSVEEFVLSHKDDAGEEERWRAKLNKRLGGWLKGSTAVLERSATTCGLRRPHSSSPRAAPKGRSSHLRPPRLGRLESNVETRIEEVHATLKQVLARVQTGGLGARVVHETRGAGTVAEIMPDGRTRVAFDNGEEHRYKASSMHKLRQGSRASFFPGKSE